jgi:hypothetical protein
MTAEEMINSDDIEIAKLGVKILKQQKGKSYTANLIKKYDKYEFKKGEGLVKKNNWHKLVLEIFKKNLNLKNTPLLSMTELYNNTVIINDSDGEFTFDIPIKP